MTSQYFNASHLLLLFLSEMFHTIDQLSVDVAISLTSSKCSSQFLLHTRTKLHQPASAACKPTTVSSYSKYLILHLQYGSFYQIITDGPVKNTCTVAYVIHRPKIYYIPKFYQWSSWEWVKYSVLRSGGRRLVFTLQSIASNYTAR